MPRIMHNCIKCECFQYGLNQQEHFFPIHRKSRNQGEKRRRDQFNLIVDELNSMVSPSNQKLDKSTVLKATIAFLKQRNGKQLTTIQRITDCLFNSIPFVWPLCLFQIIFLNLSACAIKLHRSKCANTESNSGKLEAIVFIE